MEQCFRTNKRSNAGRKRVEKNRSTGGEVLAKLLSHGTATHQEIEFISLVVEHLTDAGSMDPALLYDAPFTDIAPTGPEQVFDDGRVTDLVPRSGR